MARSISGPYGAHIFALHRVLSHTHSHHTVTLQAALNSGLRQVAHKQGRIVQAAAHQRADSAAWAPPSDWTACGHPRPCRSARAWQQEAWVSHSLSVDVLDAPVQRSKHLSQSMNIH